MKKETFAGFDPERLREERRDVDLSAEESFLDHVRDESQHVPEEGSALDEPTAGSLPLAR